MADLFDTGPEADEFALPGDDEHAAAIRDQITDDPAPAAAETEAAPDPAAAAATVDEPADAEPAAAATEPDDDPQVAAFLAKYDGDTAKALRAAAELAQLTGRQGQELGELRRLVEETRDTVAAATTAAAPQYDQDTLDAWFSENPTRIPEVATQAHYRGDEALRDAAIDAWLEIDRAGARRFERQIVAAQVRDQVVGETQTAAQATAAWEQTARAFAESHPDLEQVAPKMNEIAGQYPNIVQVLQTGDAGAKLEVLDFLYQKARGQHADTLASTARTIAREQADEAEKAIKDAAVASAATVAPAKPATVADQIGREWDTLESPYRDGWNV